MSDCLDKLIKQRCQALRGREMRTINGTRLTVLARDRINAYIARLAYSMSPSPEIRIHELHRSVMEAGFQVIKLLSLNPHLMEYNVR